MTRARLTPADVARALNATDYARAAERADLGIVPVASWGAAPPAYLCESCGHYFRTATPPTTCPRCGNPARATRTRRRRGIGIGAGVVAATLAILAPLASAAPTPAQVIRDIAPGGTITAVEETSALNGWPHAPTTWERRDLTRLVLATVVGRRAGAVRCRFGASMSPLIKCGVNVHHRSQPPSRGRTDRFAVRVDVWEDGSYVILYPPTRAGGR